MTFEKPRILTDSESNTIRGKMLVGAATPAEQLLLVGHFDLVNGNFRGALESLRGTFGADKIYITGAYGDAWTTFEPNPDCDFDVVDFKELLDAE